MVELVFHTQQLGKKRIGPFGGTNFNFFFDNVQQ
jgi:hypothetical protein